MDAQKPRYFNLRTRSVNNFAYQATQAFFPAALVLVLDSKYIRSRKTRGLIAIAVMGTVAVGASAGLIGWLQFNKVDSLRTAAGADWTDPEWPGLFVCYIRSGAVYAGYQMCTEYTLWATTNDLDVLARAAGMFKFYSAFGILYALGTR
ncbi:hypothetical protein J3458_002353 [Metarhizium acridum]|uniref:uncharacterized protein n=1 Tax=Metarhizium acridum TaxID=92637 RepID=UPI001C6A9BBC|nr:hypothetical protein J3458_002353 [Metarhizium acridum]